MAEVGTQAQQHGKDVNDVFSNQFGISVLQYELFQLLLTCCKAFLLRSSRKVLWSMQPHLTFHLHEGEYWTGASIPKC